MMSKYNFDRRNVDLRLIVVKVMIVMGNIDIGESVTYYYL